MMTNNDLKIQALTNHISKLQSELAFRKRYLKLNHEKQQKIKRQLREAIEVRNALTKGDE